MGIQRANTQLSGLDQSFELHLSFDAGRFPVRPETKRLWESPDGSSLESLLRPPMAADRPTHGWLLPWRMAALSEFLRGQRTHEKMVRTALAAEFSTVRGPVL